MCVCFKKLAHVVIDAGKSKICTSRLAGWRLREEPIAIWVQKLSAAEFSFVQGRSVFCSTQAFNWLDETHPLYGGQFT